ncbi:Crp/Fnr family transcriptional regulator [Actinomadura macrotermitis]|uniref:Cyclic nucleotide-binding domain-containing protein n=1 Tax=Actinomadura macrotermitis TaxID=2585200 RepID=A0A7K0C4X5_9ACTN|nr:Crp/Fnr family transcriptional regulator [Actinomadura macrotermitis]MQY08485.1 hypothetical protein [Actinomadura macrotermitis]
MTGSRFWDALPARARTALEKAGAIVMIRPGALLLMEHTSTAPVYVLRAGHVKVWVDRGGEHAILDVLGPGDVVGELEAVDGRPRHASVEALTAVEALVLPAARFRAVLEEHPGAVWALAGVLAERLRDANGLRVAHFPDEPARRLAGRLLRLATRFGVPLPGGGTEARVPVCRQDLGRWAGMGRGKVARILAEDLRGGVVVDRGAVTVRSVDDLRSLAGEPP